MSKNKKVRWIVSTLGLLSVVFSIVTLFTTTVFAGCQATATNCPEITCSIEGSGTCSNTGNCVTCHKEGHPAPMQRCCLLE